LIQEGQHIEDADRLAVSLKEIHDSCRTLDAEIPFALIHPHDMALIKV
jgi:hypothetical protein